MYSVLDFDLIKDVQQQLITQVCLGVEDQLSSLASGDGGTTEQSKVDVLYTSRIPLYNMYLLTPMFGYISVVVEPASNLQVTEISSKSMRVTWDAAPGDITGYKLQLIPMLAGSKRQELYTGPTQSSVNVRDLSPETEYEISLFALKDFTPSEPVMAMEKTQPVKVSLGKVNPYILSFC